MLKFEKRAKQEGFDLVIGIDEAGRGPLAGPVVASAVYLTSHTFENRIDDSKKISAQQRERAFHEIHDKACVGVGIASEGLIDEINILQATCFAMTQAVEMLMRRVPKISPEPPAPSRNPFLLIDGNYFKSDLPYKFRTIVDGDELSLSIACASIIAKVTRDRILHNYDQVFPEYGFGQHKGYGTDDHRAAIKKHGLCPIHRRSFHSAATKNAK